jgi:transcriptional regulator with XRE-family HTH domain
MSPLDWRKKKGMSLDELAKEIRFAKGYLSEVETGKKPGSLRLAKAYHKISDGKVTLADFRI